MEVQLQITIPGSIQPLDRGERFELPICDLLDDVGGDIIGGGSLLNSSNEIVECDIEFTVGDLDRALPQIIRILIEGCAPTGTVIKQIEPEMKQIYLHVAPQVQTP